MSATSGPIPAGQAEVVRNGLVSVSDMIGETLATLTDLERHGLRDPDGMLNEKLCRVLEEVWRIRWEVGPCAGAVQPETCDDCTNHFHPVEANGVEHVESEAQS